MKAGMGAIATGAAMMAALVACAPTDDGVFAPQGAPAGAEAVDPLLVGHRLMAAGEYQLARNSYIRATLRDGYTPETLSAMGSADLALGRLGQAERNLRTAIDIDETFVPAWNNLGVVLMEQGKYAEAKLVFQTAFGLDSGKSESIAQNLQLAIAKSENHSYGGEKITNFSLVRQGSGEYLLLATQ